MTKWKLPTLVESYFVWRYYLPLCMWMYIPFRFYYGNFLFINVLFFWCPKTRGIKETRQCFKKKKRLPARKKGNKKVLYFFFNAEVLMEIFDENVGAPFISRNCLASFCSAFAVQLNFLVLVIASGRSCKKLQFLRQFFCSQSLWLGAVLCSFGDLYWAFWWSDGRRFKGLIVFVTQFDAAF